MPSRSNGLCRIVDSGPMSSFVDKAGGGERVQGRSRGSSSCSRQQPQHLQWRHCIVASNGFQSQSRHTNLSSPRQHVECKSKQKDRLVCERAPERGPQRKRAPETEGPRERAPERGPQREPRERAPARESPRERSPERGPQREGPRERESSREGAVLEFWLGHPPQQRPQTTTGFVLCNRKLVLRKIQKSEDI